MKTKKGCGAAGAQDERRTAKKKHEAAAAVVLRMELHCDGCALKVRKAIKGAQGAESVRTDVAAGTVTVAGNGKADPWDLRDRIHDRMARHKPAASIDIAFVSPANPPRPSKEQEQQQQQGRRRPSINKNKDDDAKKNKGKAGRHDKDGNKQMPPESTVVLNIQLHCKGCTDRIKRKAKKIKGVKQVTVDTGKEQVTVKGTMDAKYLPDVLSAKPKRRVTAVVVPPITNNKKNNKAAAGAAAAADGGGDNHDDNTEQGEEEAGGKNWNKKNKNWNKQQQQRGEAAAVAGDGHDDEMASWMSVSEEQQYQYQYPTIFPASYGRGGSVGPSYRVELLQGAQPFSDDNPNACSLM